MLKNSMGVVLFMVVHVTLCLSCVVAHDPDLHPDNVLFHIRGMESWTADDVRNYLGEPQKLTINLQNSPLPSPHLPKHLVCTPAASNLVPLCLDSATIKITEFGVAFYCTGPEGGIRKTISAPPSFAAPELRIRGEVCRREYYDESGQLKPEKVGQVMVTEIDFESRLNRVPRCQNELLGMEDEE
ncbi:hypothetical protein BDD12DRAFT_801311 [Trichophaea hybrida]|nr:hypothetical protein BDD12DRAFT_801311 [Trichophaea hybrida]